MLLSSGNTAILQQKQRIQAILNFQTAGEEYSSIEGLVQAGDSYEDIWDYEKALDLFEQAFLQSESIGNLTKILNCAITSGNYHIAEQYIQCGLSRWYNISNYILAFHLWQGNIKPALLQMIQMIQEKQNVINMPEGLPKLLFDTLSFVMQIPDSLDIETNTIKVYASFILSNVTANWIAVDPDLFVTHWQHVNVLSDSYWGEFLHTYIEEILDPMMSILAREKLADKSPSDKSIIYLSIHAENIYTTYQKILSATQDQDMQWKIKKRMNDFCALVILTLRKFPDSEDIIEYWWSRLELYEPMHTDPASYIRESTMRYQ
jgi:tetratricopeptide (TPR) repeat protein